MSTEVQKEAGGLQVETRNVDDFSQVLKQSFRPRNEDAAKAVDMRPYLSFPARSCSCVHGGLP